MSAGFLSDDAVYLMTADGFSPFYHTDPALRAYVLRQSIFPPVYPLLLALLGGGSEQLLWSHVLTTSSLIVALIFLWCWVAEELRDPLVAMGLVLVYTLLPGTLLQNLELMSEFPYLMFSLAAIWIAARDDRTWRSSLLLAACVGLAAATRSAGYSLIVAMAIWLFATRTPRRFAFLLLAVAPSIAWTAYKCFVGANQAAGYWQFFGGLLAQIDAQGFFPFVPRFVMGQVIAVWHALLMNLDVSPSWPARIVAGAIVITALPIFFRRLRQWRLDALYLSVATLMTLLYPFPEHFTRLIVPLIPILLAYSYFCVGELASELARPLRRLALQHGATVFLLGALLPVLVYMTGRYLAPIDPSLTSWKHTSYWFGVRDIEEVRADVALRQLIVDASRGVRDYVPEGECVLAIRTALTMLYSHRIVQQFPPPSQTNTEVLDKKVRSCPNVFMLGVPGHVDQEPVGAYYPTDRLSADAFQFVRAWSNPASPEDPIAILLRSKPN